MELSDKLAHLIPHWIEHNASHAEQFDEKAENARAAGLEEVATKIEAAARLVRAANEELQQAQASLPQGENVDG